MVPAWLRANGVILVGGEALFDLVAANGDALSRAPRRRPVQRGPHDRAPRAARRLPRPAVDRPLRRPHGAMLAEDGVRLEAVVRTDEPTTLALAEFDEHGGARYRFYTRAPRRRA